MSNNYKIHDTSVDVLIKQSITFGLTDTIYLITLQLKKIHEKNKKINNFLKLKKLYDKIDKSQITDRKKFFKELLFDLKEIKLDNLEEYKTLIYYLEGLIKISR